MAIENIIEKIEEETEAKASEILSKAESQAAGIRAEYSGRAEKLRGELERRARAKAADEEKRLLVNEQLELGRAVLARKREILDTVCERARKRIESLPVAKYQGILTKLILKNAPSGKAELVVPSKQRRLFDRDFIDSLNEAAGGGASFSVSQESGDFAWGVVLKEGRRSVNLTLDDLFEQFVERMEAKIARVLFPEREE